MSDEGRTCADAAGHETTPIFETIGLRYADRDGVVTERTVTIREISEVPPACIRGICHLRRDLRTFHDERILSMFDPSTGQTLTHVALRTTNVLPDLPPLAAPEEPPPVPVRTFEDATLACRAQLEALGWAVLADKLGGADRLGCYRYKKGGQTLQKHPTVDLTFEPLDPFDGRERRRPWAVRSAGRSVGTWGHAAPALDALIREAKGKAGKI